MSSTHFIRIVLFGVSLSPFYQELSYFPCCGRGEIRGETLAQQPFKQFLLELFMLSQLFKKKKTSANAETSAEFSANEVISQLFDSESDTQVSAEHMLRRTFDFNPI